VNAEQTSYVDAHLVQQLKEHLLFHPRTIANISIGEESCGWR
jgi:hypothetical protein